MDNILKIAGLSFAYGGHRILHGLALSINKGEYVAITGDNGSGKSTLLKLILGELKPVSGSIELFGESVSGFKDWPRIGYLPQSGGSDIVGFPANVTEIVTANLYNQIGKLRLPSRAHKEKVGAALLQVGMAEIATHMPRELSGGQLQRVLLARTLVSDPEFIILDEPTTAMDEEAVEGLYQLFSQLHRCGHTILMITHDTKGVTPYADRVLHLEDRELETVYRGRGKG